MVELEESMFKIQEVGQLQLSRVIEERVPLGKYWNESSAGVYVAVDNSDGDAWTEEFDDKEIMLDWLNNKFEIGEVEEWKVEKNNKLLKRNEFQDALNILKPNDHDVVHHKDGWWSCQNNAVTSIQKLVNIYPEYLKLKEKSTPKKPKLNHYDNDCTKIICPNDCGIQLNGLNRDNEIASFTHEHCPKCGQAIDWSEDGK